MHLLDKKRGERREEGEREEGMKGMGKKVHLMQGSFSLPLFLSLPFFLSLSFSLSLLVLCVVQLPTNIKKREKFFLSRGGQHSMNLSNNKSSEEREREECISPQPSLPYILPSLSPSLSLPPLTLCNFFPFLCYLLSSLILKFVGRSFPLSLHLLYALSFSLACSLCYLPPSSHSTPSFHLSLPLSFFFSPSIAFPLPVAYPFIPHGFSNSRKHFSSRFLILSLSSPIFFSLVQRRRKSERGGERLALNQVPF